MIASRWVSIALPMLGSIISICAPPSFVFPLLVFLTVGLHVNLMVWSLISPPVRGVIYGAIICKHAADISPFRRSSSIVSHLMISPPSRRVICSVINHSMISPPFRRVVVFSHGACISTSRGVICSIINHSLVSPPSKFFRDLCLRRGVISRIVIWFLLFLWLISTRAFQNLQRVTQVNRNLFRICILRWFGKIVLKELFE